MDKIVPKIDTEDTKRKTEGLAAQSGILYRKKPTRATIVPLDDAESNQDSNNAK